MHVGITRESDVVSLDAALGGQMAATNTMVLACSSLQPADVSTWGGIYQAFQALRSDWLAFKAQQDSIPSIDIIGQATAEAVDATYVSKYNAGVSGQSYAQWAAAYQTKVAAACPGIQPPVQPSPSPSPSPVPSTSAGSDFTGVVLVLLAAGALAVGAAWVLPMALAGFGASSGGSRRQEA
jgi:hypothetical protein